MNIHAYVYQRELYEVERISNKVEEVNYENR